jgi:peptidoglycan hydrolase-like protein with peptidoglycan-binding domain
VNEPELASGDSGDWVEQLQARLHAIGVYSGALDGHFGAVTAAAVNALQTDSGLAADGHVGPQTWAAIAAAEVAAGLHPHAAGAADGHPAVGALSEDLQWRWDGERWQPEQQHATAVAVNEAKSGGHPSGDGQWLWDGTKWEPVT